VEFWFALLVRILLWTFIICCCHISWLDYTYRHLEVAVASAGRTGRALWQYCSAPGWRKVPKDDNSEYIDFCRTGWSPFRSATTPTLYRTRQQRRPSTVR